MKFVVPLVLALPIVAAPSAADVARQLREASLDPQECYRVRELHFGRGDARFFLNEGLLAFLRPVAGRRLSAVFSAEVEGGDAEILLIPPTRSERASLASFTKSPNLEERFRTALFLFTDDSAADLLQQIQKSEFNRKSPEEGLLLASQWNPVLRNISGSFEVRMVEDVLAEHHGANGFFFAALMGQQLGNFDFVYDPRARQRQTLGQVVTRENRSFYDVWASFPDRDFRQGKRRPSDELLKVFSYRIEARLDESLHLTVTSRLSIEVSAPAAVVPFEISPRMQVTAAEVNGAPAEVFRRESLRANLLRGDQNETFLVVPVAQIAPGRHEIVIRHDGDVISHAGNRVYFVGSRVNWYPQHRGPQFSRFDLTFRYPKTLSLVTSGELVEERTEGEEKISLRRSETPLRYAGFNLGDYTKASAARGAYRVDVYANRQLESALQPQAHLVPMPPTTIFPRRRPGADVFALPPPPAPNPEDRMEDMARDIATEFDWMASVLGTPPQKTLSVSPIPGQFGQGFPGLIYLSTRSYVNLPTRLGAPKEHQIFFNDLLHAHETAHQWWGNSVTSPGYEDDWLQEALANYMALWMLEKKRGTKTMDVVLADYRDRLLTKQDDNQTLESTGPVTLGLRLQNSQNPGAWRSIVYDKGTWIIHMLRRRLGDSLFQALLAETASRFQNRSLSTAQFRELAIGFLARQPDGPASYKSIDAKLDIFFDTWAAGTGIPEFKFHWTAKGVAPKVTVTGTITQTGVPDDFLDAVPVEFQLRKGKIVRWVRTASDPVTFSQVLPSPPLKVQLDPGNATLKR